MNRLSLALAACALSTTAALAQIGGPTSGDSNRSNINAQLVQLLQAGYEIKAAFAEAGIPYLVLQNKTSAYLCRGGGTATCEKLN